MTATHRSYQKLPCSFRAADGRACKRWACRDSTFCHTHRPNPQEMDLDRWQDVHPLARVADFHDVFHVVRETLNAVRQGRIPPQQAYATCYTVRVWMDVYRAMRCEVRDEALTRQMLPTLVDADAAAAREATLRSSMPAPVKAAAAPRKSPLEPAALPVELDEEAAVAAAPLPHNADEAEAHFRELMAATPPAPRAPLDSYPGYAELQQRPRAAFRCHPEEPAAAGDEGSACSPPCETAGDDAHCDSNTNPGDSSPVPPLRDGLGMTAPAASGARQGNGSRNGARNGGNGARKDAGKIDKALARALLKKIFSEMGPILGPADESSELPPAGRKPNGHGSDTS